MHLRSNIFLKIFALVIFSFELVAPAMFTGFATGELATNKTTLVNASILHSPLFSVFFEELTENEESKDDRNNSFPLSLSMGGNHGILLLPFELIPTAFAHSLLQFNMRPPLYQMHCKLIV